MNNDNTTPLYTLDRSKLREESPFLSAMFDMFDSLTGHRKQVEPQSPTDVASDKEPV